MSKYEKIALGIATLALVVALGVAVNLGGKANKPANRVVGVVATAPSGQTPYTNFDNLQLDNGNIDAKAGTTTITSFNGTTTGPIYYTLGQTKYAEVENPMTASTSVFCSIVNPFGAATSSIDNLGDDIIRGYVGGSVAYTISTSTTAVGSSTRAIVGEQTVAAGAKNTTYWKPFLVSTTTPNSVAQGNLLFGSEAAFIGRTPFILGPNETVNWRIATSTNPAVQGGVGPTGTCQLAAHRI